MLGVGELDGVGEPLADGDGLDEGDTVGDGVGSTDFVGCGLPTGLRGGADGCSLTWLGGAASLGCWLAALCEDVTEGELRCCGVLFTTSPVVRPET